MWTGGGWKKDLSLYSEASSIGRVLPLRTGDFQYGRDTPQWQVGSGAMLHDYLRLHKKFSFQGRGSVGPQTVVSVGSHTDITHRNKTRLYPVPARFHLIFSYGAKKDAREPSKYNPGFVITPVITMWNPYNVPLKFNRGWSFGYNISSMPLMFTGQGRMATPTRQVTATSLVTAISKALATAAKNLAMRGRNGGELIFQPGEALVFSPENDQIIDRTRAFPGQTGSLYLEPGYRNSGGLFYPLRIDPRNYRSDPVKASAGATMKCEIEYNNSRNTGQWGGEAQGRQLTIGGTDHTNQWTTALRENVEDLDTYMEPSQLSGSDVRTSSRLSTLEASPMLFASASFQMQDHPGTP